LTFKYGWITTFFQKNGKTSFTFENEDIDFAEQMDANGYADKTVYPLSTTSNDDPICSC